MNEYFKYRYKLPKSVYSDSSLNKLFCLTNRKSGNQLWQLEPVQEIYIFLRGHALILHMFPINVQFSVWLAIQEKNGNNFN